LELQLGEKQRLLQARDTELDGLTSKVNELSEKLSEAEANRERAERLIHEELREKTALLEAKDSSLAEVEQRFTGTIDSLERQISEKQRLLDASTTEQAELRAQINTLEERLAESEGTHAELEGLLQQERSKASKSLLMMHSNEEGETVGANGKMRGVDTLMSEREELLKARDKLIQNLMTELKEKKTQLARQEIEVWKGIERREAWKHRLSKIGIRLKD
jgi:chromosome segregation ATPase